MSTEDPVAVPYLIHTNRELKFMLERGKPLSHFSDWYPPEPDEEVIPREAFAPYVATGFVEMRSFNWIIVRHHLRRVICAARCMCSTLGPRRRGAPMPTSR